MRTNRKWTKIMWQIIFQVRAEADESLNTQLMNEMQWRMKMPNQIKPQSPLYQSRIKRARLRWKQVMKHKIIKLVISRWERVDERVKITFEDMRLGVRWQNIEYQQEMNSVDDKQNFFMLRKFFSNIQAIYSSLHWI